MEISLLEDWDALPEGSSRQTDSPEIAALDGCSDRELLEGGTIGVLHRIALYRRYDALVQKRLEVESSVQRGLSQRVWMTAFDEWPLAVEQQLSVPEWLGQIIERTLKTGVDVRGGETYLPDPFAWYLQRSLQALPPISRLLLLLVEAEQWSEERIARFLSERGIVLPTQQVPLLYRQAEQQLLEGLPAELNKIYFRGALDCLSLVPWLHPSAEAEICLFNEALGRTDASPQTIQSHTPPTAPRRNGLVLVGAGVFAVLVLLGGLGVYYLSDTGIRVGQEPPPVPPEPLPTRAPTATEIPSPRVPTATEISPPSALPPKIKAPSAPLALSAGRGPIHLLVRDPGPDGLARLRRIDPRVFYSQYQGQPYVQLGVYSSERQARLTAAEMTRLGFTVVLTR